MNIAQRCLVRPTKHRVRQVFPLPINAFDVAPHS